MYSVRNDLWRFRRSLAYSMGCAIPFCSSSRENSTNREKISLFSVVIIILSSISISNETSEGVSPSTSKEVVVEV